MEKIGPPRRSSEVFALAREGQLMVEEEAWAGAWREEWTSMVMMARLCSCMGCECSGMERRWSG